MISEKELMNTVNFSVAEMMATQVMQKLNEKLEKQWQTIIEELVNSRKTCLTLEKALTESQRHSLRLEMLLNEKESELFRAKELQAKAAQILDETLKTLGE